MIYLKYFYKLKPIIIVYFLFFLKQDSKGREMWNEEKKTENYFKMLLLNWILRFDN